MLLRKHCERVASLVNASPYPVSLCSLSFTYNQIFQPQTQHKHLGLAHIVSLSLDSQQHKNQYDRAASFAIEEGRHSSVFINISKVSWLWLPPTYTANSLHRRSCSHNYIEHWRTKQPQAVNLRKIEAGVDVHTTTALRNIPKRVDFEDLKLFLNAICEGHYDFSYLRIDILCGIYFSTYILHVLLQQIKMPAFFGKVKKVLCCGYEEEQEIPINQRVEVELASLLKLERALINNRPVPPLNLEDTSVTESKQLLPHCADGVKISSSIETAMAGCGEDDDGARSFMINKWSYRVTDGGGGRGR
ncbi:hypothetical protein KCU95_g722, partial [Aureobasidium melanogenum]